MSFKIKCGTYGAETERKHSNLNNQISWENTSCGNKFHMCISSPMIYAKPDNFYKEIDSVRIVCDACKTYINIV